MVFGVGGSSVFVCLAFSGRAAAPAVWRLGRSGAVPVLLKGRAKGGRVTPRRWIIGRGRWRTRSFQGWVEAMAILIRRTLNPDPGADLERPAADRAAGGGSEPGAGEAGAAQGAQQRTGHGGEPATGAQSDRRARSLPDNTPITGPKRNRSWSLWM